MSLFLRSLALVSSALLIAGCSTMGGSRGDVTKQADLAADAQNVLQQQMMQSNEKRIPNQLVADARCIAVFPSVIQGSLIVGGHHGQGLVTCRQQSGGFKSANPAVFSLSGGSVGLQAGGRKSSLILLFMTRQSVDQLLQSKIKLGSQIGVTAGPSGYNHAITRVPAPVVAYAVSQNGLYAGVDLSGSKMSFNESANTNLYGSSATPRSVLLGGTQPAGAMTSFRHTLQQFMPSAGQNSGNNQQQTQQSHSNQSQRSGGGQQQMNSNQSQRNGGQQQMNSNHVQSNNSQQQQQQQQPATNQTGTNGGQRQSGNNQ